MEINKFELRFKYSLIELENKLSIGFNLENNMYGLFDNEKLLVFCEFSNLKDLINYTNIMFKRYDIVIDKEVD